MKKYCVLIVLFLGLVSNSFSQKSLSDYSYIIVSEQFEFQDEKDKYQLNSLIKFLYNKHGFHAYFEDEVPENVRRCDGLFADAEGKPGFIITKVELIIRDCNGTELFRTIKGKSDIKNYKNAYYEASREAFKSIRDLYVTQKPISIYEKEVVAKEEKISTKEPNKVIATAVVVDEVIETPKEIPSEIPSTISETNTLNNLPSAKYSNYSNGDKTFLLRKTKSGYSFYEESSESDDGLLLIGKIVLLETSINFTDTNKTTFNAYFDASKNLIIEKGTSTVFYRLVN